MFHPATWVALLASTLSFVDPAFGNAGTAGAARDGRRATPRGVRRFELYFGPGGKFGAPTAKFVERSELVVPNDWVEVLLARTAQRSELRWVRRHELTRPKMFSGLAWDAGLALLGDMSEDERKEYERTLPTGARLLGLPSGVALPRAVRVTASFPISVTIRDRDPLLDRILVVRSPYPPEPARYVPFGGTVKVTSEQLAWLKREFGARQFEGDQGDLRFTVDARVVPQVGHWLNHGGSLADTPLREAREELGHEHQLLSQVEISDLYAAQHGKPYRELSAEARRRYH